MSSISLPPNLMPPRGYLAVIRIIDRFTEWTGTLFVLFIIPLIMRIRGRGEVLAQLAANED